MIVQNYINKEEISIDGHKYLVSSIPSVQAKEIYGEIVRATQDVGDIGMTFLPSSLTYKMMEYAAADNGNKEWIMLNNESSLNDENLVPNLETLIKLEAAMIRKNFGFLFDGSLQKVLEELRGRKVGISSHK